MEMQPPYFIPCVFFALLFSAIGAQWQALIIVLVMPYVLTGADFSFLLFFSLGFAMFGHFVRKGGGGA
jgi:hypothetical protein